jgi:hypothetical protein
MKTVTIGSSIYRIVTTGRDGRFIARAERADTGERFGIECTGVSADAAADRLSRWLEWQHDHAAALEELQRAEGAYHRTIAGSAFVGPIEGPSAVEMQKESLEAVEEARRTLDEIRARRPDPQ